MLIQAIGVLLGITGIILKIHSLLILGGILCLVVDLIGFLNGTLKPIFPLMLYGLGYLVVGSWVGIFYGSIAGNTIDVAFPLVMALFLHSRKKKGDSQKYES